MFEFDLDGAYGDEFFEWGAPGGVGEIDYVEDVGVALAVEVGVEEAGTFDGDGDCIGCDPMDDVFEEIAVVGEVLAGVAAIDVGGEEGES